jgi:hypothetical protein
VNAAVKVAIRLFMQQPHEAKRLLLRRYPVVPRLCGAFLKYQHQRCAHQNSEAHYRDCDGIEYALVEHGSIPRWTNADRHEQTLRFQEATTIRLDAAKAL